MKLTTENVGTVLDYCLYGKDEDASNAVYVDVVFNQFGFHPGRLAEKRDDIASMLEQLPQQFKGGASFMSACDDRDGHQWGEHANMEMLFALGLASGMVTDMFPRYLRRALPGEMPVYVINPAANLIPDR